MSEGINYKKREKNGMDSWTRLYIFRVSDFILFFFAFL
jgi:hypothetical protein